MAGGALWLGEALGLGARLGQESVTRLHPSDSHVPAKAAQVHETARAAAVQETRQAQTERDEARQSAATAREEAARLAGQLQAMAFKTQE